MDSLWALLTSYHTSMDHITNKGDWMTSCNNRETFTSSNRLWNTLGLSMNKIQRLWTTCYMRAWKSTWKFPKVLSTWMSDLVMNIGSDQKLSHPVSNCKSCKSTFQVSNSNSDAKLVTSKTTTPVIINLKFKLWSSSMHLHHSDFRESRNIQWFVPRWIHDKLQWEHQIQHWLLNCRIWKLCFGLRFHDKTLKNVMWGFYLLQWGFINILMYVYTSTLILH